MYYSFFLVVFRNRISIIICKYKPLPKGRTVELAVKLTETLNPVKTLTNLLKGTISFLAITFFRYFLARFRGIFLIAWAVSLVFLKWTLDID